MDGLGMLLWRDYGMNKCTKGFTGNNAIIKVRVWPWRQVRVEKAVLLLSEAESPDDADVGHIVGGKIDMVLKKRDELYLAFKHEEYPCGFGGACLIVSRRFLGLTLRKAYRVLYFTKKDSTATPEHLLRVVFR